MVQKLISRTKNVVYDVTDSPLWKRGDHQGSHIAGSDLTSELSDAPHGYEVFQRFQVVGKFEDSEETQEPQRDAHESFKSKLRT